MQITVQWEMVIISSSFPQNLPSLGPLFLSASHEHKTCTQIKPINLAMSLKQKAPQWSDNRDELSSLCLFTLISIMSGPAWRAAQAGLYSIWPFLWSPRHVITLRLTFNAVKRVSSANHNKDNAASAFKSIAHQVDMWACACWHCSWAVIWSQHWSKCLWWLGVIWFADCDLWSAAVWGRCGSVCRVTNGASLKGSENWNMITWFWFSS